ncbi:hypothetical protein WH52_06245 [Tenacibaculum holothuriorum]|uniref:Bacterial surface antigen (D15) domain-containing protein n=1 Tax=Tenacibaculum holothuriorum TaxID=1635173 RepID=A0A1Y2PDW6_9FLAO|nr:hypothetical protein [Tenacibaculum holothuriorum]OSY88360.1 hypothetical protein WH52_06245 [Tenacibaculum holothuriorum]
MNKKHILSWFLILASLFLQSQENLSTLKGKELHNKVRLNFIPVEMPSEKFPELKPTMGMMGLHYQIPFNDWLYGGVGMYAALTGDQGGLFTLGVELGVNKQLYKNLYLDANFHFGGGGGYRKYINDGGFINPNIGLQYKKNDYSIGVQYSHVNFYSGEIKSNSVSFFVEIPSVLRLASYKDAQKEFEISNLSSDNFWKRPIVKNVQQVRFDFFQPIGKSKKDNGGELNETLYVLGFEYQKYLQENIFLFVHTDAIYKGLRAGFMDLFFGAGYHPYQSKYVNIFGKIGIGAAGGRIAREGGLTIYPSAGVDLKISNKFAISGHGGYYRALDGDFEAYTYGVGIKYYGLNGGADSSEEINTYKTQGISVGVENQTYFNVAKFDPPNNKYEVDLQLLALQFNYDISNHFYLIGEAGFAYDGQSGGYAHGLAGIGYKTPSILNNKLNAFIDLVGGAAGGAGVDTDEGIVVRPTAGLNYNLANNFSLSVSGGKFIAPFGNVNSTNVNIGLNFNFASLTGQK